MQRGSDRLSARRDEEMKHELQGLLRSGHPTRVEEWHDPEPPADDDPDVALRPVPTRGSLRPEDEMGTELARYLSRTAFPAPPRELLADLKRHHAPDRLVDLVSELPAQGKYRSAHEVVMALTRQQ
ncbi:DUF2795 domain-containing protein [Streptomyces sp. ISL-1]|uniref:DUF2795 domain-containing protein n=1 Tax=Streptomyces sp. ISL-1 TaxID=2817657 RepID=UPI001BE8E59F|nr:DUF2795 domain-containing protein [Streptomyces sp. ISL-1]MBT2393264.1 DUF2795 domain-containing protein [Streptomyces sp. ISL-1]